MTTAGVTPTVAEAYLTCDQIMRSAAGNFSYGIRLLPPQKRSALSAVYALARRLDDIGDGDLPHDAKIAGLAAARADIKAIGAASTDPVFVALADAARRFPIPMDAFVELVDGVEMDVLGVQYETFDDLVLYCRRVAGTIGRLSVGIFGAPAAADAARVSELADTLGVALQQTNILRDVREDLLTGRIYLPREDLGRFGVTLTLDETGRLGGPDADLTSLLSWAAQRAETWYDRGLALLDSLDRRSAACCGAMAGIYLRLNRRIRDDPAPVLTQRLSLPGWEKAVVAARSLTVRPHAVKATAVMKPRTGGDDHGRAA